MSETAQTKSKEPQKIEGKENNSSEQPWAVFANPLNAFLHALGGMHEFLPGVMLLLRGVTRSAQFELKASLKEHGTVHQEAGDLKQYHISRENAGVFRVNRRLNRLQRSASLFKTIPENFLVAYISEFDTLMGNLLRATFVSRPAISSIAERTIQYADVADLCSIEEVKQYLLEEEIEAFLRDSLEKRFSFIEKKFKLSLQENIPYWSTLIELLSRRNLIVHTGGKITKQYLKKMRNSPVDFSGTEGEKLSVDSKYMQEAYLCLYDTAVRMTFFLWRKFLPGSKEAANSHLNSIAYELMKSNEDALAVSLLDFATSLTDCGEEATMIFIINKAQACKFSGDTSRCLKILDEKEWGTCADRFQICVAVLRENFDDAIKIMLRNKGNKDFLTEGDYKDWPVFRKFREMDQFQKAYRCVFGHDFHTEKTHDPERGIVHNIDNLISELEKMKKTFMERDATRH